MKHIFDGLPEYVRITILSQIRRLLSTSLFNYEDREDLIQDLLLFYLKRFYSIPNLDEALVVHALKQYASNLLAKAINPPPSESENENESDNEYESGDRKREPASVDKPEFVGAPSVDEVAAYAKESGYTIDPVAFVKWNEERGWMNGKKYIALDWRKAVRKWFCKDNGVSYSEMETMANVCSDMLSKVKAV